LAAYRQWLLTWLKTECGADPGTTLVATCHCADDLVASNDPLRALWGAFTMGGLGALPSGGRTAMIAFAHHIPDSGAALILYGPHIGITGTGCLGQSIRPGQAIASPTCGALMMALARLRGSDTPPQPSEVDDDLEQAYLERQLFPHRARILAAPSPEKDITEVAYELIHRSVHRLLARVKAEFHGAHVAYVGGVIIHTDLADEDWIEVRDQGWLATDHAT
jgi:hypothetical protein